MSQVVSFNHFNVTVSDMDRSLGFWQDLLGLELLGRGVVEYPHLDRIVGLENTRIEWAELALPGGGDDRGVPVPPARGESRASPDP